MIRTERQGGVTLLRIDRHEQRNALDPEHAQAMLAELEGALATGSRCVVITGEGTSFCSGADLDVVRDDGFRSTVYAMFHRIAQLPIPVIAAVNGPAIGAGTQLAISADLRVAGPRARFAVPTARLGLALDPWSVRRLVSLAGGGAARALLIGVDGIDASRAHGLGLVDRLGDLDAALDWAQEIAGLAPLTLAYNKLAVTAATELTRHDPAVEEAHEACWSSADAAEAFAARAQGRPAAFSGA